jgi:hypothetical protein
VIVRHLLQHEVIVSRRGFLGGLGSLASVLALGGCANLGATGARFVALSGPYITGHNHTQASERRAGEALVRAGAGFYNDRRTGDAGAA